MKANTNVASVKFNNAKTTIAREMTPAQYALFERGEELGHCERDYAIAWGDALKLCKAPADRVILRSGFVSTYRASFGASEKTAHNRFDYLAKVYAPAHTSRKSASNAKKAIVRAAGRPEDDGEPSHAVLSDRDVIARNLAAVAYISTAQVKHAGDAEMLEVLGELLAILTVKK